MATNLAGHKGDQANVRQLARAVIRHALKLHSEAVEDRKLTVALASCVVRHAVRQATAEKEGQTVVLTGLTGKAKEHNGELVTVLKARNEKQEYEVQLPNGEQLEVRGSDKFLHIDEEETLRVGVHIAIRGLRNQSEYNGCLAKVEECFEEPERYEVRDLKTLEILRLRKENLVLVLDPADVLARNAAKAREEQENLEKEAVAAKKAEAELLAHEAAAAEAEEEAKAAKQLPLPDLELRILSLRRLGSSGSIFVEVNVVGLAAELNFRTPFPAAQQEQTLLLLGLPPDSGSLQLRMAVYGGGDETWQGILLGSAELMLPGLDGWSFLGDLQLVDEQGFPSGGILSVAVGLPGSTAAKPRIRKSAFGASTASSFRKTFGASAANNFRKSFGASAAPSSQAQEVVGFGLLAHAAGLASTAENCRLQASLTSFSASSHSSQRWIKDPAEMPDLQDKVREILYASAESGELEKVLREVMTEASSLRSSQSDLENITGVRHAKKLGVGDIVVAAYDYQARRRDELTIRQADTMKVVGVEIGDEGWCQVEMLGIRGVIPSNFVQLITAAPVRRHRALGGDIPNEKDAMDKTYTSSGFRDTCGVIAEEGEPAIMTKAEPRLASELQESTESRLEEDDAVVQGLFAHALQTGRKEADTAVAQALADHSDKLQQRQAAVQGLVAHAAELQQPATSELDAEQEEAETLPLPSEELPVETPEMKAMQLKADTRNILSNAASSGELEKALKEVFVKDLFERTARILETAERNGELEKALQEVFDEEQEAFHKEIETEEQLESIGEENSGCLDDIAEEPETDDDLPPAADEVPVPAQTFAAIPSEEPPEPKLLGEQSLEIEASSSSRPLHPLRASYALPPPGRPRPSYPEWKPPSRGPLDRIDFSLAPGPSFERVANPMRPLGVPPVNRRPRRGFAEAVDKRRLQPRHLEQHHERQQLQLQQQQLPPISPGGEPVSIEALWLSARLNTIKGSLASPAPGAARSGLQGTAATAPDPRPSPRIDVPVLPPVDPQVEVENWRHMVAESALRLAKGGEFYYGRMH